MAPLGCFKHGGNLKLSHLCDSGGGGGDGDDGGDGAGDGGGGDDGDGGGGVDGDGGGGDAGGDGGGDGDISCGSQCSGCGKLYKI